jgi:hypothetical protein
MANNHIIKATGLFMLIIAASGHLAAQQTDSLKKKPEVKKFVFIPLSFSSPSFTTPIASTDHKLEVSADSVVANLPYFGNSNSPQFGRSDDQVIEFVSTDFEYSTEIKKKGKYEITIKPKDARGVRLFMTLYSDGEAQLDVTSPRRQSMTFKGYIK